MKLNKKMLGLVLSGVIMLGMVGCNAGDVAEDAYNEAKQHVEEDVNGKDNTTESTDDKVEAVNTILESTLKDKFRAEDGYDVGMSQVDDQVNIVIINSNIDITGYSQETVDMMCEQADIQTTFNYLDETATDLYVQAGYMMNVKITIMDSRNNIIYMTTFND